MDTILSGNEVPEFSPYVGLLLSHHFVRIAYEGAMAIRSGNAHVGIPDLAALLNDAFSQITARARHLTKMLDNNKKSYADILAKEPAAEWEGHHNAFTGNAVWPVRWLETDLGLYLVNGALGPAGECSNRLPARPATRRSRTPCGERTWLR